MDVLVRKSEINGKVLPPPSKSYTHRAFFAASLSRSCIVLNPLYSGDTLSTLKSCEFLGAKVRAEKDRTFFEGVDIIECSGYINVENSGTTLRILLGLLAQSPSESVVDGDESLRKRPNKTLALALKKLGASVKSKSADYAAPVSIRGKIKGGNVEIKAESSQFVSSLLFTLPLCDENSNVRVIELKSKPYIDVTLHVLNEAGVEVDKEEVDGEVESKGIEFFICGGQNYSLKEFKVPSDFSSASYLIAAGLMAGKVVIEGMFDSMQGDRRIVEVAKEMGGNVKWDKEKGVIVAELSELEGIEVDASDIPDLVPTIAVLGAVAKGKTVVKNAEHLRIKEIDRIKGCYENLRALGVEVEEKKDGIVVRGLKNPAEVAGTVNSLGDHRMALSFSLLGLISKKGVLIKNAEVVNISYPDYFRVLKEIGANVENVGAV